jgi:hypothetical protein
MIGSSREIGSPKTRRATINDKSWIAQSDGLAPMAQLCPTHDGGCKDKGNAQPVQSSSWIPLEACPEAAETSVFRQSSALPLGWHAGVSAERQQFDGCSSPIRPHTLGPITASPPYPHHNNSSLHPEAAHWRELKKVQEQFSAELRAQAKRISDVESSIDIGALQEAVDTAVSEKLNERLGELMSGICAVRADLQKTSKVQQGTGVMSTLQEDLRQDLLSHLEEAIEREKQSRLKFEDEVMTCLSGRCGMCTMQPQALQELRAQIQIVEKDLRAETCHPSLEKSVATLASTMRSILGDSVLGLSPACSVSTDDVPGSSNSEATTAAPESTNLLVETTETLAESLRLQLELVAISLQVPQQTNLASNDDLAAVMEWRCIDCSFALSL